MRACAAPAVGAAGRRRRAARAEAIPPHQHLQHRRLRRRAVAESSGFNKIVKAMRHLFPSTRAAQAAPPRMTPGTVYAAGCATHTPRCARISAATDQAIYRSRPARVEGSAAVSALKGNCLLRRSPPSGSPAIRTPAVCALESSRWVSRKIFTCVTHVRFCMMWPWCIGNVSTHSRPAGN